MGKKRISIPLLISILIVASFLLIPKYLINISDDTFNDYDYDGENKYIRPHNLPEHSDDWIITNGSLLFEEKKLIENKTILLTGNLIAKDDIEFHNVTFIINSTKDRGINDGYVLKFWKNCSINDSLFTAFDARYVYSISFSWGTTPVVYMNNSELSYIDQISQDSGKSIITNCTFTNLTRGFYFARNIDAIFKYCVFNDFERAIWCTPRVSYLDEPQYFRVVVSYSIFVNYSRIEVIGGETTISLFKYNYWGTNERDEIASLFWDNDAVFTPWLEEPPFDY